MTDTSDLQRAFREAVDDLGERTLKGRQLVWKPGLKDTVLTNINIVQTFVNAEHRSLLSGKMPGISSDDPAPPASTPGNRPPPPLTRPRATGGPPPVPQRSGWNAARPQPKDEAPKSFLGKARQLFLDPSQAALKTGTVTGVVGLLNEGVFSGGDIFLKPDFSAPTLKTGFRMEKGPMVEKIINDFAEMMQQSGLVGNSAIEGGKEIAGKVASCLPVIGAVLTLSEAAVQTVNLALDLSRNHSLGKTAVHVTPGQPRMALEAARSLFQRHAAEMGARMAINYTAGGASVAGLFLDFGAVTGPLAGIIKSVLNLVITITNTCITLTEMKRGNQMIRDGFEAKPDQKFYFELLMKCPILGAYMLTEAESSVLYAFLLSGPLPKTWQQEVIKLKPKMDQLISDVNVLQRRSPFHLAGGSTIGSYAKGDHFLNMNPLYTQQRLLHEANLTAKRDPKALGFLQDHASAISGGGIGRQRR